MAKLFIENTDEEKELEDGSPLACVCEEAGLPFACTEGICGTCIFEVVQNPENLSPASQAEIDFLSEEGTKKERMACQCKINQGFVKIRF